MQTNSANILRLLQGTARLVKQPACDLRVRKTPKRSDHRGGCVEALTEEQVSILARSCQRHRRCRADSAVWCAAAVAAASLSVAIAIGEEHDDLNQQAVAAASAPAPVLLQEKMDGLGAQEQILDVSMVLQL